MARLIAEVPDTFHRQVKQYVLDNDTTVSDLIVSSLKEKLSPSQPTAVPQAPKQSDDGFREITSSFAGRCQSYACQQRAIGKFTLHYHENETDQELNLCEGHRVAAIKAGRLQA